MQANMDRGLTGSRAEFHVCADGLRRFALRPGAHHFSAKAHTAQQRRMADSTIASESAERRLHSEIPSAKPDSAAPDESDANTASDVQAQHQRSASFGTRLLFDQQQYSCGRLNRAAKTKP